MEAGKVNALRAPPGSGNSGTIFNQSGSYDNAGNATSLATTQAAMPGQSGSGGSETQNFCYDEQNRLVWAGNSGTQPAAGNGTCGSGSLASGLNGAGYSNAYVYTHLGQLWQGPLAGGSAQYQYLYCDSSHPHELTGLYATSATCSNKTGQGYATSYDPFGNVTGRTFSGTTATLSYDNLNHFTEWNAGSTNQEWYLYDGAGNRVLRRFTNSNGTTMIVYAFGLEEHNYSGAGAHQNDTYYYSLGGRQLGALDGNGTTFYLTDTLGSILASFNNAAGGASVKGNQVFAPYGTGRYYKGNINTLKGFTGQYNDGSGLDYYNARYYDPVVGVFLSADTANGNMAGMNPYAYVDGNPETYSDPTGRYIAGPSGQTYYPGSPYYTQGGEAYSVKTGQPYNGDGFVNGWYPGQGPNALSKPTTGPGGSTNQGPNATPQKTTATPKPKRSGSACNGTSIFGLCVKNTGRFWQGVGEVLVAAGLLVAALIGAFQASGILWLIGQAVQFIAFGIINVMKNGISNILGSLQGPPGKGFTIFLDILQVGTDIAANIVTAVGFIKNIGKILRYPGKNIFTKFGGVSKAASTFAAAGNTAHGTYMLAVMTVANVFNGIFGGDYLWNDIEHLQRDISS